MTSRLGLSIPLAAILFLSAVTVYSQKPELVVQTGHSALCAAFHPDGKTLASGGDGTVKLWDIATGRELRSFVRDEPGHNSPIASIAFHPSGKTLATGDQDGMIKLWDVTTGNKVGSLEGHTSHINTIAFSPDGKLLASGSIDETIKLWNLSACTKVCTALRTLKLRGPWSEPTTVAFTRDGKFLISSHGKTIRVWDVATGKPPRTLIAQAVAFNSMALSPDGKFLASISDNGMIKVWSVATGRALRTLVDQTSSIKSDGLAPGNHIAFSANGKLVASVTANKIGLWEIATGKQLRTLAGNASNFQSISFSHDGKLLVGVTWDGGNIKLWEVTTGKELRTLVGHSSLVKSIAFSPDGKLLASTSADKLVRLWDLSTGKELRTIASWVRSLAFSPDSKLLAGAGGNNLLKVWDSFSGRELQTLGKPKDDVLIYAIAFHPNGKVLASLTEGMKITLWDVSTGKELSSLSKTVADIESLAFSPDGKLLALLLIDGRIQLLDVSSAKLVRTIGDYSPAVESIAFSPDGKLLPGYSGDGTFKLWDVSTGKAIQEFKGSSHINAMAFSPDGKFVASGGATNELKLWDVSTGKELRRFVGATPRYDTWIAFHPSGRVLASVSEEEAIKLWDVNTGQELAALIGVDQTDWLVITPDGLFDGSPAAWNQTLWRFDGNTFNVAPAEAFFSEFFYPNLLSDIFAGERPHATQNVSQKDRRQPNVQLELSNPQLSTTEKRTINLRLRVNEVSVDTNHGQGSGAQDVRLFRNGLLVSVWKGDVIKGENGVVLEASDVPIIAGDNRFEAYAFNHDNIKSANAELLIKGADSLKRRGSVYILAIGINEYANSQFNLSYAVADSQAFSAEFKRQQETLGQYERVEVSLLQDEQATKANILRALEQLSTKAQPEDAVIIYFAGHGTAEGNRFYLIPHDIGYSGGRESITEEGLDPIFRHSISDVELQQGFEKMDAGRVLLVIDACNSGQALEDEEKRRGPMNSKGLAQLAYEKGMYVLTAAQSFQAALELAQLGHGLLTYTLVEEGLKTSAADFEPKDGEVLLREWLDYSTQRVPQMQEEKLKQARAARSKVVDTTGATQKLATQRPRLFYRHELDLRPFVIAKTSTTQSPR